MHKLQSGSEPRHRQGDRRGRRGVQVSALRIHIQVHGKVEDMSIEEFATKYAQDKPYPATVKAAVIAGVDWFREQMISHSIQGRVHWYDGEYLDYSDEEFLYIVKEQNLKVGDDVRLVIIKDTKGDKV